MKPSLLSLLASVLAAAAPLHVHESAFIAGSNGSPAGWTTWSARAETVPRTFVDQSQYRSHAGSLAISGNSSGRRTAAEYRVPGVEPGKWYRFTAYYRSTGVRAENWQIGHAWIGASRTASARANLTRSTEPSAKGPGPRSAWKPEAPAEAATVSLKLYLSNAPLGVVWWDDISLEQIAPPLRVRSPSHRSTIPVGAHSAEERCASFWMSPAERWARGRHHPAAGSDHAVPNRPDIFRSGPANPRPCHYSARQVGAVQEFLRRRWCDRARSWNRLQHRSPDRPPRRPGGQIPQGSPPVEKWKAA